MIHQIIFTENKQIQFSKRFFWAKQTDTDTPETHWERRIDFEKDCDIPDFSTELLMSKFITSITDRKLRDKPLKEKNVDVPKNSRSDPTKHIRRQEQKNTIPEALI